MCSEHFFDLALELPVFVGLERVVVQSAERDAEFSSSECLRRIAGSHFFFWASDSLSVNSPTSCRSWAFSRFSLMTSETVGWPSVDLAIQPYIVFSEMP